MTDHAETLTHPLPERFSATELDAAAGWVREKASCVTASPARLVATFRALDAYLAKLPGVVALRDLLPGSGLELLYLPPTDSATSTLLSLPGEIHQEALADIGRALLAEFLATGRDMMQIETDDGARLIVHAIEARAVVLAALGVRLV